MTRKARLNPSYDIPLHLCAVEVRRGWRTPHAGRSRRPAFRALRGVVMPRARLEITKLLVLHLIELAEELDHLLVLVAVVCRDVMPGTMPQWSPDDGDPLLAHHVA